MFDGDGRSRKPISLGGRSGEKKDAKSLIESARLQREERAMEKLKQTSATKMQRIVRGYLDRANIVRQYRLRFDQAMKESNIAKDKQGMSVLANQLLWFYMRMCSDRGMIENEHSRLLGFGTALVDSLRMLKFDKDDTVCQTFLSRAIKIMQLFKSLAVTPNYGALGVLSELLTSVSAIFEAAGVNKNNSLFPLVCDMTRCLALLSRNSINAVPPTEGILQLLLHMLQHILNDDCCLKVFIMNILAIPNICAFFATTASGNLIKRWISSPIIILKVLHCAVKCLKEGQSDKTLFVRLMCVVSNLDPLISSMKIDLQDPAYCNYWELLAALLSANAQVNFLSMQKVLYNNNGNNSVTWDRFELVARKDPLKLLELMVIARRQYASSSENEYKSPSKVSLKRKGDLSLSDNSCTLMESEFAEIEVVKCAKSLMCEMIEDTVKFENAIVNCINTMILHPVDSEVFARNSLILSVHCSFLCNLDANDARYKKILNLLAFRHVQLQEKKDSQYLSLSNKLFVILKRICNGDKSKLVSLFANISMNKSDMKCMNCEQCICLLFCTIFSFQLQLLDDEDLFVNEQMLSKGGNISKTVLMWQNDTIELIETIKHALFKWTWNENEELSLLQTVFIGSYDLNILKKSVNVKISCCDKLGSWLRTMLNESAVADISDMDIDNDTSNNSIVNITTESTTDLPTVESLMKTHLLLKLFCQLYDRFTRYINQGHASNDANLWTFKPSNINISPPGVLAISKDSQIFDRRHVSEVNGEDRDLVAYSGAYQSNTAGSIPVVSYGAATLMRSILLCIPQVIRFQSRVAVLQYLIKLDKYSDQLKNARIANLSNYFDILDHPFVSNSSNEISVRRTHILQDSAKLLRNPQSLKKKVRVEFISEQGHAETGIDGGGLFKEYVDNFLKTAFASNSGYFLSTSEQWLIPNPNSSVTVVNGSMNVPAGAVPTSVAQRLSTVRHRNDDIDNEDDMDVDTPNIVDEPVVASVLKDTDYFKLIGLVLGKALYEGLLVDSQLCVTVLNALINKSNQFNDMVYFDTQLFHSLKFLKDMAYSMPADGSDAIADLGLTFSSPITGSNAADETVELVPGAPAVTNENVFKYLHLLVNYKLNVESAKQCNAIVEGFRSLIALPWVQMFSAVELQLLIGGEKRGLDVRDLQAHCAYGGGYHQSQPYIQAFWRIVSEMSSEDQGNLLKFVTSCSRQPLLGFGQLSPVFGIQKIPTHPANSLDEQNRRNASAHGLPPPTAYISPPKLPTAATCMNLLKLPEYLTAEMLKDKLLYAIRSQSGFELT